MASNFIPMLSSSPPPIDDDDECLENDDEDNDFGAFKSVKDVFVCSPLYNSTSNEALESSPKCQANALNNAHSENGLNIVQLSMFSSHSLDKNKCKESEDSNQTPNFVSLNCDSDNTHKLPSLNKNLPKIDEIGCGVGESAGIQNACLSESCLISNESQKHLPFINESKAVLLNAQDISNTNSSYIVKEIENGDDEIVSEFECCQNVKENQQSALLSESFSHNIILKQKSINTQLSEICELKSTVNGELFLKESCEKHAEDIETLELVDKDIISEESLKTSNFFYSNSGEHIENDQRESESSLSQQPETEINKICFKDNEASDKLISSCSKAEFSYNHSFYDNDCSSICSSVMTGKMSEENYSKGTESSYESKRKSLTKIDENHYNLLSGSSQSKVTFEDNLVTEALAQHHDSSGKDSDSSVQHEVSSLTDEFDDFQQAEVPHQMPEHEFDSCDTMFDKWKAIKEDETSLEFNGFGESFASFPCENDPYIKEISSVISEISESSAIAEIPLGKEFDTKHLANDFDETSFTSVNEHDDCSESAILKRDVGENFADFEAADFVSASGSTFFLKEPVLQPTVKESERGIEKISKVISAIYPVSEENCSYNDLEKSDLETWEHSSKSHRLWDKLQEVEHTPGLRFQWGISHSFQMMLRSVNIDYHSIDPIPPVHFDWGSSGLVNPLDSNHVTSTLMDLSFLSSSDAVSSQSSFSADLSLENELLVTCSTSLATEINNKPPILEQLLSSTAPSSFPNSHQFHRPPNISEEASHVLDQLPDLSFMRAKVLMFPISNIT